MDVFKILLITLLAAVGGGGIAGIISGKHAVKKASGHSKPLLSIKERIIYAGLLVGGAACILAGIFLVSPSDSSDMIDPGMEGEGYHEDGMEGDGFDENGVMVNGNTGDGLTDEENAKDGMSEEETAGDDVQNSEADGEESALEGDGSAGDDIQAVAEQAQQDAGGGSAASSGGASSGFGIIGGATNAVAIYRVR